MTQYSPSRAAERSGFSLDTLRYYERIGLLGEIARDAGGRRSYSDADLGWLEMVRCLRDTGMPIAEMLRFAELCRAGEHTVPARVSLLEQHDAAVEERIAHLRAQQERVRHKIEIYRGVLRESGQADAGTEQADAGTEQAPPPGAVAPEAHAVG